MQSALAGNPFQNGLGGSDISITQELLQYQRDTLGAWGSVGNNSHRDPPLTGAYTTLYNTITSMGGPSYIQTAASARVGDLHVVCTDCADDFGVQMVELPGGYTGTAASAMTPAEFTDINTKLAANAAAMGY